jgi:hypothetical protein
MLQAGPNQKFFNTEFQIKVTTTNFLPVALRGCAGLSPAVTVTPQFIHSKESTK